MKHRKVSLLRCLKQKEEPIIPENPLVKCLQLWKVFFMGLNNKKEKFKEIITLNFEKPFEVEFTGSPQAKTAIIFVHGFGVKRQSRGLFVELESSLPDSVLSVRAEYSQVRNKLCRALPFKDQCLRLKEIINYVQTQYNIDKFIYVGHSQGCITIGLHKPHNALILLLAPPIISPFKEFINTEGWKKPGSYLNLTGNSRLVRSDLVIEVPPKFWEEFKKIDAHFLYKYLSKYNNVKLVFAENDTILGKQPSIDNILTHIINNADHDFSSTSRKEMLNLFKNLTDFG